MRALSVKQPWANLIARGGKTIETRTWKTAYRGPLLICAGKTPDPAALDWLTDCTVEDLDPRGVAVAVVNLVECRPMVQADELKARCGWSPRLWAWVLADARLVAPRPVLGRLGLFQAPFPEPC